MQRDSIFFDGKLSLDDAYGVGVNIHSTSLGDRYTCGSTVAPPAFGAALEGTKMSSLPSPLNEVEFRPTETCPKNFVIFDQTEKKSWVMFNPALADNFNYNSNLDCHTSRASGDAQGTETNDEDNQVSYSPNENSEDINALLSSEEDDKEDQCTAEVMMSTSSHKSFASSSRSGRKRERMRKMVKVLRGIIPGGEVMDTVAVLDETVNYLKSLHLEAKKLGIHSFKD
uniref:BHLH transcription factor n=1 Tax=Dracaena cambodiana TaxID=580341 RepID=A0A7M3UQG9_9ASPA|nr:bHLH transcription factor [Dracaena cambodiana]